MATAAEVLKAARTGGVRIATAESCNGGLIAGALTDVAGSSDVFERGFVTYSNRCEGGNAGVSRDTLAPWVPCRKRSRGKWPRARCVSPRHAGGFGPGSQARRVGVQAGGARLLRLAQAGKPTRVETVDFGRWAARASARDGEHALGAAGGCAGLTLAPRAATGGFTPRTPWDI